MMKAGVAVSDTVEFSGNFSLSLSPEILAEGAEKFSSLVKLRFRSSRARMLRLLRAVLPESSSPSSSSNTGLGVVKEARMISCSDSGNCRMNSLSSGDKKARGSSLVTVTVVTVTGIK